MSTVNDFIKRLDTCPPGTAGWRIFEDLCVEILDYLFTPAITLHSTQTRTYSGIQRRDAVYSNRNITPSGLPMTKNWHHLYEELKARLILFEFKNYDTSEITQDEINQTRNYMSKPMGNLAILIANKKPTDHAHRHRNTVFTQDNGKVILLMTKDELKEMLAIRERGEDPSDLILDMLEDFYLQHE